MDPKRNHTAVVSSAGLAAFRQRRVAVAVTVGRWMQRRAGLGDIVGSPGANWTSTTGRRSLSTVYCSR